MHRDRDAQYARPPRIRCAAPRSTPREIDAPNGAHRFVVPTHSRIGAGARVGRHSAVGRSVAASRNRLPSHHNQSGSPVESGAKRRSRAPNFSGTWRDRSCVDAGRAQRQGARHAWRQPRAFSSGGRSRRADWEGAGHPPIVCSSGSRRAGMRGRFWGEDNAIASRYSGGDSPATDGARRRRCDGPGIWPTDTDTSQRNDVGRPAARGPARPRPTGRPRGGSRRLAISDADRFARGGGFTNRARRQEGRSHRQNQERRIRRSARPTRARVPLRGRRARGGGNG